MNKKLYLLPFLIFALNAQDADPAPITEPVITDLDLLVESVKTTASIRAKEDRARLNKFLSDKNKQQSLLDNMKYKLTLEERRSERLTKEYEDNDAELSDLEEQLTLKLGLLVSFLVLLDRLLVSQKVSLCCLLTNIEFPDRIEFLGDLAERKSLDLPTTEELERLWYEILK